MVVYVLPIDVEKFQKKEIDAAVCEAKIKALKLTTKNIDPLYREEAEKVWVRASAGAPEMPVEDSIIVVDPELGFTAEDIADDFSFGNGTTVGGVRLKDGKWVICGFVVFDHTHKGMVDGKLIALKKIFKGTL